MKNLLLPLLFISLMSCMTEEENFIKKTESYISDSLVEKMNDPQSYEAISTKIVDTIKLHYVYKFDTLILSNQKERLISSIYSDSSIVMLRMKYGLTYQDEYDSFKENKELLKKCIHKLDSVKNVLILKNDTNKIACISLVHTYRFKNKYNGTEIDTLELTCVFNNIKSCYVNHRKGYFFKSKILGSNSPLLN